MQITIEIPDAEIDALAKIFDDGDKAVVASRFAELAVVEHLDWIQGRTRHRSLTEQYIARVEALYVSMLKADEAPSFNRLYNSFNMPHGQAAYIARALSDKTLRHWRRRALADLLADLKAVADVAEKHRKNGDGDVGVLIRTRRMAAIELVRLCDDEWARDSNFLTATPKGGAGEQRLMDLAADSIVVLIERLKKEVGDA